MKFEKIIDITILVMFVLSFGVMATVGVNMTPLLIAVVAVVHIALLIAKLLTKLKK